MNVRYSIADPSFLALLFKEGQKLDLVAAGQHAISFLFGKFDHIFNLDPIPIDEPGADDEKGTAFPGMAVYADPASISETHFKDVHDAHHMLKCSTGHVFPTLVETVDAVVVEVFRDVAETSIRDDAIPAVWVFPGLLKVQNCADFLFLELLVDMELFDESLGGPLHGQDIVGYPVRVEAFDGIGHHLVAEVVLVLATLSPTELAEEDDFLIEVFNNEASESRPPSSLQLLLLHILL